MNALSLFSNVGIGETYLKEIGINVVVANELLAERAKFYSHSHSDSCMINGDITKPDIFNKIMAEGKKNKIKLLIATPPCQGMSTAGKMKENDPRNSLIIKVLDAFNVLKPDYMLIENVPQMLKTSIIHKGVPIKIVDFIRQEVGDKYDIKFDIFDASDYGTPQYRKRAIIRVFKKKLKWKDPIKQKQITVRDAIGELPSLESGQKSSIKYHVARTHNSKHILWMKNTPTGKSAFENNDPFRPMKDGRLIKGFGNSYKRIEWDRPSPTVTMANGVISSQNNVHPGRKLADGTYSDARVLTWLEIFRLTGLPDDWNPPQWASDGMVREVIGEALMPKLLRNLLAGINRS